jgi:cation diffusion facilitator family transporter
VQRGVRLARFGLLINGVLALVKLVAGVLGNSHALIADAVESFADLFSSLVVWGGLRLSARSADLAYHFGYGKAESLATAVVGLMLVGAASGIAIDSVREIRTPHHVPAPFTLVVLVLVIGVKEALFRFTRRGARELGSDLVAADAWHHRSDAITSGFAFVGISVALLAEAAWADDVAALGAAVVILVNGVRIIRPGVQDLLDRAPDAELLKGVEAVARTVPGVRHTEKLRARKSGTRYLLEIHVQADPGLSLHDAHGLGHQVKSAICDGVPAVRDVVVHMEPFEP